VANILVLGAGFGGITAASKISAAVPGKHDITLVDRKDSFFMGLRKPWALVGLKPLEEGTRSLTSLKEKGVKFLKAEIQKIDVVGKKVTTSTGVLPWDCLVIALGAEPDPSLVQGLPPESSYYDAKNLPALHRSLKNFKSGRLAVVICGAPYKCPPAPFEASLLIDAWLRQRGDRHQVQQWVYAPDALPMPVAGPAAGKKVMEVCASRGINVATNHKIRRVDAGARMLHFENNAQWPYDLLLAVPPHRVPAVVKESGLCDASGWIPVHPETLATLRADIFACGDCSCLKLPAGGMLPKSGFFAEMEGEMVADRLLKALGDGDGGRNFDGRGYCWFEAGNGQAMKANGNFFLDPAQRTEMADPTKEAFEEKEKFEKDRLEKWFA
jgi:sulfide:quinone oxidoreductase